MARKVITNITVDPVNDTKPLNKATLKATPEIEDFAHKYTEDGQGTIGRRLLDGYFAAVQKLINSSDLGKLNAATAVEIGCGEGYSTKRLSGLLPKNVQLEASEYVAHMIAKAEANNPGMTITEESVYELQHADNSYDLVFLLEVLEHLDFPDKGLRELNRVTKPGGYMILGVPREPIWCALNLARLTYIKRFGNTPGHLNHWSTRGAKKYVECHFGPVVEVKTPLPWTLLLARKPE